MGDYGSRIADGATGKVHKLLRKVYAQAEKELKRKMAAFLIRHRKQGAIMLERLKNGTITPAAYHAWMRGQVFIGERWQKKIDQVIGIVQRANEKAYKYIQRYKLWVFKENYNRYAYETEIKTGISFDIFNREAVERLLIENPSMLPAWKIDEAKDYLWNRQKVETAITQGIIQGESVDQVAERLASELKSSNMSKMRMFARTAITGAQNAGRQKQMEDAVARGINIKKQWIATLDDRTRDTHQHLDGQVVPVNESFHVGLKLIRYPGDPTADPAMVYNCRCTMKSIFPMQEGQKRQRRAYRYVDGHRESYVVEVQTYDEWKKMKEREQ